MIFKIQTIFPIENTFECHHYLSVHPSVRLSVRSDVQLELTKLTRPDLHHVVGLLILTDVR